MCVEYISTSRNHSCCFFSSVDSHFYGGFVMQAASAWVISYSFFSIRTVFEMCVKHERKIFEKSSDKILL